MPAMHDMRCTMLRYTMLRPRSCDARPYDATIYVAIACHDADARADADARCHDATMPRCQRCCDMRVPAMPMRDAPSAMLMHCRYTMRDAMR
jgi:hypothetical protein